MAMAQSPVDFLLLQRRLYEAIFPTEVLVGAPELYVSSKGDQRDANEAV
jgi:hypothetical protein